MIKMAKTGMLVSILVLCATSVVSSANAASNIGVTAAVNRQAKSILPTGKVRTVVVGNKVAFKERINTSGTGLVQILFTDGSSLTVGANASLVIDQYVYNPKKGTGKLAISFGKGVMRFVGGKLSKNRGGVTVRTTVGTAGIRGGIANIAVKGGKGVFSLLFGNELNFVGSGGKKQRIYQPGYTILSQQQGGSNKNELTLRRTLKTDTAFFQSILTSKPGQRGGARRSPTNRQVRDGNVPRNNSGIPLPRIKPLASPKTVVASPLPDLENGLIDLPNAFEPVIIDNGYTPGVVSPCTYSYSNNVASSVSSGCY